MSPKWLGRCPECGQWNSYVEATRGGGKPRLSTGLPGLDRVLAGGLVPGSVVLLGGEPGIGKSPLLLQAGRGLAEREREVLYASAEESVQQVRLRAERLGISDGRLLVLAETDASR